jgi:hypothetical protein
MIVGGGVCGGYNEYPVEDQHRNLVHQHHAAINAQLGANHQNFHVDKVLCKVVAGSYTRMHLTADGKHITVLFFEPLGDEPATLENASYN